ncbi:FecR family protein [Arcticibacter sp. MXS-1]|uniref:FecR family protein n=1 Tax=Arcticibacter sp. MXS-1 TaxID=3341726 RepID=UPI0035A8557A
MADYLTYDVEDFVVDDLFLAWVLDEDLFAKYFWEKWMEEHPEKKALIAEARSIVKGIYVRPEGTLSDTEVEEIRQNVRKKIAETRDNPQIRQILFNTRFWLSAAAIVVLLLTAALFTYLKQGPEGGQQIAAVEKPVLTLRENNGEHAVLIRLPDQSSVVLKPGSSLSYLSPFQGPTRDVKLRGEAFFEVKHNEMMAFIVHTDGLSVRVLGTSFRVRAFKGDKNVNVVVNSGKVAVINDSLKDIGHGAKEKPRALMLVANEEAVFNRTDTSLIKEKLDTPLVLSPQVARRVFRFHNVPFGKVVEKLQDAYGVEIVFDKETIGNCPISASLSNQPLYEKMKLICEAVNAKFSVNDHNITVEGKGCAE